MATLLAHVRIKPGKEAAFEAVARQMYERTHADEPTVVRYEYWRGQEPGLYYTLESFEDFAGFMNHQASPHHEGHGPDFRDMIESLKIEWLSPVADAAPLAQTKPQDLPASASPLMHEYAKKMPVQMAPWWAKVAEG